MDMGQRDRDLALQGICLAAAQGTAGGFALPSGILEQQGNRPV